LLITVAACSGGGVTSPPPTPDPSCAMQQVAVTNEGWVHVAEGSTITYRNNPPASGPHYPVWARFDAFTQVIPRGYWVHNLEHGAAVLLYRPDAPASVQQALRDAFAGLPNDPTCGNKRALLTPDPLLDRPVAVVAADVALLGQCVDPAAVRQFVVAQRGHGPEQVCTPGSHP
jgi:hypothetical protein